jgi:TonB-dependent SusC/RagA subfamily outer membrane receptor
VLSLEAVVVTGVTDPTAGTRVPFTVGRVSAEQVPVPPTNAVEALAGRVAGAQIVSPGQPGSGINVQLRTPASISKSNAPLIVVDGVILAEGVDASTADLNALDVESVEVVKGAAAASLYGSRASNGVLQIRTRRGPRARRRAHARHGAQRARANRIQNPIGFSRTTPSRGRRPVRGRRRRPGHARPARHAPGQRALPGEPVPGRHLRPGAQFFSAGDFGQHSVTGRAERRAHQLPRHGVAAGAGGVIQQAGGYARNDVRINLDHRLRESLSFGLSSYYSRSSRSDLDNDLFFDLVNMAPDVDISARDTSGNLAFEPDPISRRPNPLYTVATQNRRTKRTRFLGSANARFAPLEWLSFEGTASYDRGDRQSDYFLDRGSRTVDQTFDRIGGMEMLNAQTGAFNGTLAASVLRRVGDLTARTSVRALAEREGGQRFGYRAVDLLVPGVRSLNNVRSRPAGERRPDGFLEGDQGLEIRTNSYVGALGLDYRGRYIVDGLVRRDGSSLFGPEEQLADVLPGERVVAHGEERWWPLSGLVTEFKPRISRGTGRRAAVVPRPVRDVQHRRLGQPGEGDAGQPVPPPRAGHRDRGRRRPDRAQPLLAAGEPRAHHGHRPAAAAPAAGAGRRLRVAVAERRHAQGEHLGGHVRGAPRPAPRATWSLGLVADRTRNRITEFNRSCFITQTVLYRCAGVTVGTMYGARFATDPRDLGTVPEARRASSRERRRAARVGGPGPLVARRALGRHGHRGRRLLQWGRPIVARDSAAGPGWASSATATRASARA